MTKKNPVKVCKSVGLASDLLKSVANPNRLAILCYLMEKQCTVAELEEDLGIRQPTLSQQLTYLRDRKVISGTRLAKNVLYRISDPRILPVIAALRGIYSELDDVTMTKRGNPMRDMGIADSMYD